MSLSALSTSLARVATWDAVLFLTSFDTILHYVGSLTGRSASDSLAGSCARLREKSEQVRPAEPHVRLHLHLGV